MQELKKVVRVAGLLGAGFVLGCAGQANSQQLGSEGYALVYNGAVSDADSTEAIVEVVKQVGLPVRYVSDLQTLPALLDNARVLIIGGTNDDVQPLLEAFTPPVSSALKTYLRNGGRYLGMCGGAFLASTGWPDEGGFVPALGIVPAESDAYDEDFAAKIYPVQWLGAQRLMYYQAGPEFTLRQSHEAVQVVARFANNQPAALISAYGQGKVAVSGPHPEAPETWKDNAEDGDKMQANIHLAEQLLRELLADRPVDAGNSAAKASQ